ncbi:hypothetical protein ACRC6Q_16700 [Planococcus sp. SE5232]|uniref:hypothetical protein n=1 Tax=unclassified Planococcus (in: firmicutes) TaxID=2662419 RepID=UPI003D6A32E7
MVEEFDEEFLEGTTFPVVKLNGGYKSIQTERISYERILEMLGVQGNQIYTVTYFTRDRRVKGSLSPGESIPTVNRLIINADRTDKA